MIFKYDQIKIIKFIFLFVYLIFSITFLYFFFKFEIFNYIKSDFFWSDEYELILKFKNDNFLLVSLFFFLFSFFWVFFLGFGSVITILAGLIFEIKYAFFITMCSSVPGATCLYIFAKYFCKELVYDNLLLKYKKQIEFMQKKQFLYFIFLRMIPGVPYQVLNLLPIILNMKIWIFFTATMLGSSISKLIIISISSGLATNLNAVKKFDKSILLSFNLLIPLCSLLIFIILGYIVKKRIKSNLNNIF